MTNEAIKTCSNWFSWLSQQHHDDILSGDEAAPLSTCLKRFFSSPVTVTLAAVGAVAGIVVCVTGEVAGDVHNSTDIAKLIGVGTDPWRWMAITGGISAGVLVGSAISYGCKCIEKPEIRYNSLHFETASGTYISGSSTYGEDGASIYTYERENNVASY